jgi:hypothetical protein
MSGVLACVTAAVDQPRRRAMGSGRRRREEDAAKSVVEGHLPDAELRPHDLPESVRAYDFDLITESGTAALEVTQCIDRKHAKTMAAWRRLIHNGVRVEGLEQLWLLMADTRQVSEFRTFANRVREPLQAAEAGGLTEVYDHQFADLNRFVRAAAQGLRQLGVWSASAMPPADASQQGLIHLTLGDGFSAGPGTEPALQEMESFLAADDTADVREKLQRSGHPRKHAFAWAEMSRAPVSYWMFGGERFRLPDRPPNLPPEITDVWWTSRRRGWYWSAIDGWSALGPLSWDQANLSTAPADQAT